MNKLTILIAEDDPISIKVFHNFLDNENYELIFAKNGEEAIEIIKSGRKVDLILMDIRMPEIDGFVAGGIIKMYAPDVPIIAQTAYTEEIVKARLDRKVFAEIINKPIIKDELYRAINKHLTPILA